MFGWEDPIPRRIRRCQERDRVSVTAVVENASKTSQYSQKEDERLLSCLHGLGVQEGILGPG